MKITKIIIFSLILTLFTLSSRAQDSVNFKGTWQLQVGYAQLPYKLVITEQNWPGGMNIYLIKGYILNNQGKKFPLVPCDENKVEKMVKDYDYEIYTKIHNCSHIHHGNGRTAGFTINAREGESRWVSSITAPKMHKIYAGEVFNIYSDKLQAKYTGYKLN